MGQNLWLYRKNFALPFQAVQLETGEQNSYDKAINFDPLFF